MARHSMSLNDAFSLVRSRKSNVGPNFNFMEQLHAFGRQLAKGDNRDATVAAASSMLSPHSTLSATSTTSISSKVGSAQSSIDSADGCSSGSSGVGGLGGGGGTGDESGLSSAASSADRKCQQCGTPQPSNACAKCPATAAAQFLSPTTIFGLSPDSGIEFDRWTPGLGE